MLIEIDSSELITCIINNISVGDKKRTVRIEKLYKIANVIEDTHPSIVVDINKLSIEAFRCRCSEAIQVSDKTISVHINNPKMKEVIKKYRPSEKNKEIIVRAYKKR